MICNLEVAGSSPAGGFRSLGPSAAPATRHPPTRVPSEPAIPSRTDALADPDTALAAAPGLDAPDLQQPGDHAPIADRDSPASDREAQRSKLERKGIKIGPFVFVPEWSALEGPDPWAHRKGEPRMLTLFWTIFLLAASGLTLFGTRGAGLVRAVQYQTTARRLLLIVAFGAAVLWPMVRLCQQPPERSIGKSILLDLLGIAAPVAAVLLPLPFLTGWNWSLLSVVWFVIVGWALVGLAIAHLALAGGERVSGVRRAARRGLAMAAVLALVVGGAYLGLRRGTHRPGDLQAPGAAPDILRVSASPTWWAASPLSHVHRLTTSSGGLTPVPTEPDARAAVLLWVSGMGLALWASLASRR